MIKLIVVVKRNAAMSPAQFHEYWRTEHARKVNSIPACAKYIRRYVQAHTLESEYAAGEPAYDGTAELWFDSIEDKDAFYSDPDYLAVIAPDERVFADMAQTRFLLTHEEEMVRTGHTAIARWHQLVAARDLSQLDDLLADEVVFQSPAVHTPQVGKAVTKQYLAAALHVLNNGSFRYVGEWLGESSAVLEFETVIEGLQVNGVDIIHWDGAGRITRFKVMVRPIKGLQALIPLMARELLGNRPGSENWS
jgi:uncharacterized protein (TIGR02118 family)